MRVLYETAPLIGFGLPLILAFLVLRQNRHSRTHQIFALFLVSIGLWAFTVYGMRNSPTLEQGLPWEKAIIIILSLVAVFLLHFVLLLTRTRTRGWYLVLAYLSIPVFASIINTDLIVKDMREMWYGHGFIGGPLLIPYMVVYYGIVIISLFILIRAYRKAELSQERNRYFYIILGGCFCLAGLSTDFLAANFIRIYPMGIPSNILFSALCAYSMLKYHLLDIQVVVRKGTAYIVVSAIATSITTGLLVFAYFFLTQSWSLPFWLNIIFVIIVAVSLQPMLRWAQQVVDKRFYRARYDFLNALENLGEETKAITDLGFIAESLVHTIASAIKCKSVLVLLPDNENRNLVHIASRGLENAATIAYKAGKCTGAVAK